MNPLRRIVLIILTSSLGALASRADEGKEIYTEKCAACHGEDGKAHTPAGRKLHVKDLTQSKLSDVEAGDHIRKGTTTPKVTSKMPAFEGILTSDQITALVAYIRTLRE